MSSITIVQASLEQLETITDLFNAYRIWYRQQDDRAAVRAFLHERLAQQQSIIFLALLEETPAAFVQLYPIYSSARLSRGWLLNDLFVMPHARLRGVASALLQHVEQLGRNTGANYLRLITEITNTNAQELYASHGWQRDEQFYNYIRLLV